MGYIRCLLSAWRQPINSRSVMIREHFVLAVRYAMVLKHENVRHLYISDYTKDTFVKQPGGAQEVVALVFSMSIGKKNISGYAQLGMAYGMPTFAGMAVWHAYVRRCCFGAVAS